MRFGWLIILFFIPFLLYSGEKGYCSASTLDYIYIDSSVDEAAGGHAAIRLGDSVFHFQYYDDGLFRLVKDPWHDFRYQYNDLQNRTLSIASLPLGEPVYTRIKNRFLTRYLLQEKRFSSLLELEKAVLYFGNFPGEKAAIEVPALGFFERGTQENNIALELKTRIAEALGETFLTRLFDKTVSMTASSPLEINTEPAEPLKLDYYTPAATASIPCEAFFNAVALREATAVLANGYGVQDKLLIDTGESLAELNETELVKLQDFREQVITSIIQLLKSERADRGETLLLQTARYHALSHSLLHHRIFTLYPFSDKSVEVKLAVLESTLVFDHESLLHETTSPETFFIILKKMRYHDAKAARDFFFNSQSNDEITYNLIETTFGRLAEIERAERDNDVLRIEPGHLLPSRCGYVKDTLRLTEADLWKTKEILAVRLDTFRKKIQSLYSYNLIHKNCVTELLETLYSAFPSKEAAALELGGYLEPGKNLSFVPFKSFQRIQSSFTIDRVMVLPSLRKRYVQELGRHERGWSWFRESNTITSTIYYPWEKDSVFLFFTDDTIMLRPLYGFLNLFYGLAGSLTGIMTAPLDNGLLLKRSAKGLLFSVPELAFVNIRKGTFPAVVEND